MSVRMAVLALLCFISLLDSVTGYVVKYGHEDPSINKVTNWDLEADLSGWTTVKATVTQVSGGYSGSKSVKIDKRTHDDGGLQYTVQTAAAGLKRNTNYYFSTFLKQLTNSASSNWGLMRLLCEFTYSTGARKIVEAGRLVYLRVDGTWKQLGGDIKTPNEGFTQIRIFLRVQPMNIVYLLDTVSMTEIVKPSNWKAKMDAKIKKYRMDDVTLSASLPAGTDLANTRIKVELVKHQFCFGSAIRAILMLKKGDVYDNYRKFVTDTFNCLGFENALKWRQMEPTKGKYNTAWVENVMNDMIPFNMTWRGHALHWNIQKNNPNWIQGLTGAALTTAVKERVDYVSRLLKGRLEGWDVCNEHEHKHFIEDASSDLNLLDWSIKRVKMLDPSVRPYLNDYEVVRNGRKTSAIASRAKSLLARNIPIGGIGIQSHLRTLPMDAEVLERRVQIASGANLPVTITEFSVHSASETVRAQALEQAFMVYFSEPMVNGIYLWGFSDQQGFSFTSDMYLTKGATMTPNAAGRVMVNLIKNKWHTSQSFTPTSLTTTQIFPAYHGTYKVTVTTGGKVVYENNNFYASNQGNNVFNVKV